ncbi:MAG: S10 family peptidase [Desertimonas sp.]
MVENTKDAAVSTAKPGADDTKPVTPPWDPPPATTTTMTWAPGEGPESLELSVTADWTVLRREESPAAEMFAVAYVLADQGPAERPVTFVFNGGPGASSAYLHVGAVGPRRVALPDDGSLPRAPIRLVDNAESWVPFTDLVFVDPVGTGLSRPIPPADEAKPGAIAPTYWTYDQDLAAIREFIGRWLSRHGRWGSPIYIAGESYGGYRVARLVRSLPADEGVGLAGALLISPAIELGGLNYTDYALEPFIDAVPTMAVGAFHHGRRRVDDGRKGPGDADAVIAEAAEFATGDYAAVLVRGAAADPDETIRVYDRLADLIGLERDLVHRLHGRVPLDRWARELLHDEGRVVGWYDVTQTAVDPFPDRPGYEGSEPTLFGPNPAFTMGINQLVRTELGIDTDRRYELLSFKINTTWSTDDGHHAFRGPPGAADDLRNGLTLDPHLRAMIVHGRHDLVTPVRSTERLIDLMRLAPATAERVETHRYDGGHMFYAIAASREAFAADVAAFYRGDDADEPRRRGLRRRR